MTISQVIHTLDSIKASLETLGSTLTNTQHIEWVSSKSKGITDTNGTSSQSNEDTITGDDGTTGSTSDPLLGTTVSTSDPLTIEADNSKLGSTTAECISDSERCMENTQENSNSSKGHGSKSQDGVANKEVKPHEVANKLAILSNSLDGAINTLKLIVGSVSEEAMLEVQPLPPTLHPSSTPPIKQERGLENKTEVLASDNFEAKNSEDFGDDSGLLESYFLDQEDVKNEYGQQGIKEEATEVIFNPLDSTLEKSFSTGESCPKCGTAMRRKQRKNRKGEQVPILRCPKKGCQTIRRIHEELENPAPQVKVEVENQDEEPEPNELCAETGEEIGDVKPNLKLIKRIKKGTKRKRSWEGQDEDLDLVTFQCKQCFYVGRDARRLRFHMTNKHPKKWYICNQCDHRCTTERALKAHINCEHLGIRFTCNECNYTSKRAGDLKKHKQNIHSNIVYKCGMCDFEGRNKRYVTLHENYYHKGIGHKCKLCSFVGKYVQNLKDHMDAVHDNAVYQCDECSYTTNTMKLLNLHFQNFHKNKEPLLCTKCTYSTTSERYMKNHMKVHMEDNLRMIYCKECDYSAKNSKTMKDHVAKKHSKEPIEVKEYFCELCEYVAHDKGTLANHRSFKHEGIMHECSICGVKYSRPSLVYRHMRKKHPEVSFSTSICGRKRGEKNAIINEVSQAVSLNAIATDVPDS